MLDSMTEHCWESGFCCLPLKSTEFCLGMQLSYCHISLVLLSLVLDTVQGGPDSEAVEFYT